MAKTRFSPGGPTFKGDLWLNGGYNVKLFLGLGLKPYTHFLEDRAKALAGRLKPYIQFLKYGALAPYFSLFE